MIPGFEWRALICVNEKGGGIVSGRVSSVALGRLSYLPALKMRLIYIGLRVARLPVVAGDGPRIGLARFGYRS